MHKLGRGRYVRECGLRMGHICDRIRTNEQVSASYTGECLTSLHIELEFLAAAVCPPLTQSLRVCHWYVKSLLQPRWLGCRVRAATPSNALKNRYSTTISICMLLLAKRSLPLFPWLRIVCRSSEFNCWQMTGQVSFALLLKTLIDGVKRAALAFSEMSLV
jgi:hypothetical protein